MDRYTSMCVRAHVYAGVALCVCHVLPDANSDAALSRGRIGRGRLDLAAVQAVNDALALRGAGAISTTGATIGGNTIGGGGGNTISSNTGPTGGQGCATVWPHCSGVVRGGLAQTTARLGVDMDQLGSVMAQTGSLAVGSGACRRVLRPGAAARTAVAAWVRFVRGPEIIAVAPHVVQVGLFLGIHEVLLGIQIALCGGLAAEHDARIPDKPAKASEQYPMLCPMSVEQMQKASWCPKKKKKLAKK